MSNHNFVYMRSNQKILRLNSLCHKIHCPGTRLWWIWLFQLFMVSVQSQGAFVTCSFNNISQYKTLNLVRLERQWTAFRNVTRSQAWVFWWLHHFKEGYISSESDKHLGCHSPSRKHELITQEHDLVQNDKKTDYSWNGWRCKNFTWLVSGNFNQRFRNKACLGHTFHVCWQRSWKTPAVFN